MIFHENILKKKNTLIKCKCCKQHKNYVYHKLSVLIEFTLISLSRRILKKFQVQIFMVFSLSDLYSFHARSFFSDSGMHTRILHACLWYLHKSRKLVMKWVVFYDDFWVAFSIYAIFKSRNDQLEVKQFNRCKRRLHVCC